ncbi:phospholipase D family nuclease [Glaciimonas soli]|uniref:phospholipase D n=1 Tax=Glaciimonas soli TaxID=2590999 RepID=A0A843YTN7_9BURK|nr:phospholipase D family protein [Glaciimonas soli]MQR00701.1 phospholipase D family protein [Glaciimonas soli]
MKKIIVIPFISIAFASAVHGSPLAITAGGATTVQTRSPAMTIESAFSPDDGAEALVLKVINRSVSKIRLAAYSFNSPHVVEALVNAKRRGVDVKVIVDDRRNKRKNSIAALNLLVNADIPTRTISVYAMHHDKYIVSDDLSVQNGSFNYSKDAATSNSENVVVVWNNPELAKAFLGHWENRWSKGIDYKYSDDKGDAGSR